MMTVAELARQLDDLGWVLSAVCLSHVWHVTLTGGGAAPVSASDRDLIAALTMALARAHQELATREIIHG